MSRLSLRAQRAAPLMTRKRMRDQPVHEISLGQSAGLPKLGIHADRGEARERVDLVDKHVVAFDEEIYPGEARAAEQPKHLNGQLLKTTGLLRRKLCRNQQSGTVRVDIFGLIRIEAVFARRHDLAE